MNFKKSLKSHITSNFSIFITNKKKFALIYNKKSYNYGLPSDFFKTQKFISIHCLQSNTLSTCRETNENLLGI